MRPPGGCEEKVRAAKGRAALNLEERLVGFHDSLRYKATCDVVDRDLDRGLDEASSRDRDKRAARLEAKRTNMILVTVS